MFPVLQYWKGNNILWNLLPVSPFQLLALVRLLPGFFSERKCIFIFIQHDGQYRIFYLIFNNKHAVKDKICVTNFKMSFIHMYCIIKMSCRILNRKTAIFTVQFCQPSKLQDLQDIAQSNRKAAIDLQGSFVKSKMVIFIGQLCQLP